MEWLSGSYCRPWDGEIRTLLQFPFKWKWKIVMLIVLTGTPIFCVIYESSAWKNTFRATNTEISMLVNTLPVNCGLCSTNINNHFMPSLGHQKSIIFQSKGTKSKPWHTSTTARIIFCCLSKSPSKSLKGCLNNVVRIFPSKLFPLEVQELEFSKCWRVCSMSMIWKGQKRKKNIYMYIYKWLRQMPQAKASMTVAYFFCKVVSLMDVSPNPILWSLW